MRKVPARAAAAVTLGVVFCMDRTMVFGVPW
jgi:hypothetical protein